MILKPNGRGSVGTDSGQRISNLLLVILVGVILLEGVIAVTTHRSDAEWLKVWQQGTAEEQVLALQILANRSAAFKVERDLVRQLLSSPEPLLREFAFFPTITRSQVKLQRQHLDATRESPVRLRQNFFFNYSPGPSHIKKNRIFRRLVNSLGPPSDQAQDHDQ